LKKTYRSGAARRSQIFKKVEENSKNNQGKVEEELRES